MVCDDSLAIRGAIVSMLETDPAIRVVARAVNGKAAVEDLARTPVDVLVLDIEMPVMDGIAALPLLLKADPQLRIIMASTLTTRGADIAMRALRMGAADYVPKPSSIGQAGDETFRRELIEKVKGLARLRPTHHPHRRRQGAADPRRWVCIRQPLLPARLLAIGSSTWRALQALFTLVQGLGETLSVPGRAGLQRHAEDLHANFGRAHQQAARPAVRRGDASARCPRLAASILLRAIAICLVEALHRRAAGAAFG